MLSQNMEPRSVSIRLLEGSFIRGKVNIKADSQNDFQRVSDFLKSSQGDFIVIFDATVGEKERQVVAVNKHAIAFVYLMD